MLAGTILAEAAMEDGLHVVQTQTYGPEARLGASKSEVVISTHEIAYPEVDEPDLVLCFSRDAYLKYGQEVAANGVVLLEETIAQEIPDAVGNLVPFRRTAHDLGNDMSLNVIALGALVALTGAVSRDSLRNGLKHRMKPEFLALNEKALEEGFKLGEAVAAKS